jgi:ABC-type lipoprotein export system ATPase subunit
MDSPVIAINQLERTFAAGDRRVKALRGVTIDVPRGAFVVLMGPSGSGKTTLLNLIGCVDTATSGVVEVAGHKTGELGERRLTDLRLHTLGFIFQTFNLVSVLDVFQSFALMPTATAYENVELGLRLSGATPRREWDVRVRRCLAAVGLTSWMHHRPYEMSGGQQQRVAIARALAIRPQIILADEPTGDLDSRTGRQVLTILRGLCDQEGVTLLMATHDPAAAEFATDLYRLRDGLVESHERAAQAV